MEETVTQGASAEADAHRPELFMDPAVSRMKFERELAAYRALEKEYQKRGWFLVHADYPKVFLLMSAPQLQPVSIQYAITIDFTNYDLVPPSVGFVNPFTGEALTVSQVPPLSKKRAAPPVDDANAHAAQGHNSNGDAAAEAQIHPIPASQIQFERLVQGHGDRPAFLCVAGTREYHAHPYHSNDPWLGRRNGIYGTLHYLLDIIWRHGILPLTGYSFQLNVQIGALQVDPARVP